MTQIPLWFERKFEFSFPVQQYPNLCVRLRGTPARLEDIFRGCPREILIRKPQDRDKAKWSAQEHAGHLLDLEPLWLARVADFQQGGTKLTIADLTNRKTHEANHNARPLEQILVEYRKERGKLLDRLEQIDASVLGRSMLHPRLKAPMRLVDHLYFVAEHEDHHLAHIWALVT